jgi:hypothetical protein
MANKRRSLSAAEEVALLAQVESRCPLCGRPLFYKKKSREYKEYEVAHIYPLNPTSEEVLELNSVELLHNDVNHPDNLIPLCATCHIRFDKPRTAHEYQELASKKRQLLRYWEQQALQVEFPIERQIRQVLDRLNTEGITSDAVSLDYEPRRLDDKFDKGLPFPVRQKIKHAVSDYYSAVRLEFVQIEQENPSASELIFTQVKSFYLKQKTLGLAQSEIFANVVGWIRNKSESETLEAAEAVAAFFVQDCEVFG